MSQPKAPKAPDPMQTGAAQTGTNVSTAIANQIGQMVNQNGPYGSKNYTQSGSFQFTDPNSNTTYTLPQWTENVNLNADGQYLQKQGTQTEKNLADLAVAQSGRLGGLLSKPMNTAGLPDRMAAPTLQGNIAGAGNITRTYGTDFSADRQRVEEALMSRLDPRMAQDRASLENRLRQQGITPGSVAWDREMDQTNRASTDARMQAILAGGQEQSRMTEMEAQRAAFQNAAQAQQFGQNAQQAAFGNTAAQQGWQNSEAARAAMLNERTQLRQQPINEIMALMSGSQVTQPQFGATPGLAMPTTDYAGLINQGYANQMGIYGQQMNNWNGLWGGLMGAGAKIATGGLI